jgi:hypothetical protein
MRALPLNIVLLCGALVAGAEPPAAAGSATAGPRPAAASAAAATAPATAAAGIAAGFQQQLGAKLQAAMAAGGPVAAIEVCKTEAPAIAARVSRESGWEVRRVGTRVRNPATGRPDPWEQAQLAAFERRLAAGERPETIEVYAVVDAHGAPTQRYMKAITTAPQCLVCHGEATAQPPELRARLLERYPADQATGYRAGELRGAFTLQRAVAAGR